MEKVGNKLFSHAPRCLFEQILHNQNSNALSLSSPTIERFTGALLFVDISGFTMLAQRMDVNQLSHLINQFFTKLIDIIHAHGGDVIKFLGDAMFILWKVVPDGNDYHHRNKNGLYQYSRVAAMKAATCGMEIIDKCGHYPVDLSQQHQQSYANRNASHIRAFGSMHDITTFKGTNYSVTSPLSQRQGNSASSFLSVHCGLGFGVIAGLDIGHNGRWEYLLAGSPLNEVASAECEADKGDLVASSSVYELLKADGDFRETLRGNFRVINVNTISTIDIKSSSPPSAFNNKEQNKAKQAVLLDTASKHIHEVLRAAYDFEYGLSNHLLNSTAITASQQQQKEEEVKVPRKRTSIVDRVRNMTEGLRRSIVPLTAVITATTSNDASQQSQSAAAAAISASPTTGAESLLLAELREVIVLFISLSLENPILQESGADSTSERNTSQYGFLQRNESELAADHALLSRFQGAFTVLATEIMKESGQIRQFIIDDKGTVCIATWGLRSSMGFDNAAAAVNSAMNIIKSLQDQLKIVASIGITSGKVYCGLVGSVSSRSEYAVMGRSVNLAARLMGKSPLGEILCDKAIRSSDRDHFYVPCDDIDAKGYEKPVAVFKPVVMNRRLSLVNRPNRLQQMGIISDVIEASIKAVSKISPSALSLQKVSSPKRGAIMQAKDSVIGREVQYEQIFDLLRLDLVAEGDDNHDDSSATAAIMTVMMTLITGGQQASSSSSASAASAAHRASDDPSAMSSSPNPTIKDSLPVNSSHSSQLSISSYRLTRKTFKCSQRTFFLVITGPSGIGKHCFYTHLRARLTQLGTTGAMPMNIILHKAHTSRTLELTPFGSWREILFSVLADDTVHSGYCGPLDALTIDTLSNNRGALVHRALDKLLGQLPDEWNSLRPLLKGFGSSFERYEENEETLGLSGTKRSAMLLKLLHHLFRQYQEVTGRLVVFCMGCLRLMDSLSFELLKRILKENTGFMVLSTFMTNHSNQHDHKSGNEFIASFALTPNFKEIVLGELSRQHVQGLLKEVFASHDLPEPTQTVSDMVCEISGGFPLYVVELGRAVGEYYKSQAERDLKKDLKSQNNDNNSVGGDQLSIEEYLHRSAHVKRVEGLILFRFDMLSMECQLLLKAITVACANGQDASLAMVAAMVKGNDYGQKQPGQGGGLYSASTSLVDIENKIRDVLRECFQREEFVIIKNTNRNYCVTITSDRTDVSTITRRSSLGKIIASGNKHKSETCWVNFKLLIEQQAINSMMLDEQKILLHDKLANYLSNKAFTEQQKQRQSASEIFEEAFHWEMAQKWHQALPCYYRSGIALYESGAMLESKDHFTSAYNMFLQMKMMAGLMQEDADGSSEKLAQMLQFRPFQIRNKHDTTSTTMAAAASSANGSKVNSTIEEESGNHHNDKPIAASSSTKAAVNAHHPLTKEEVNAIFKGNSTLFALAVSAMTRLGEACVTLGLETSLANSVYQEVMELVSAIGPAPPAGETSRSPAFKSGLSMPLSFSYSSQPSPQSVLPQQPQIVLQDPKLLFPVLTGILTLYRTGRLQDDAACSREMATCQLFVTWTKSDPKFQPHLAVALSFLRNVYIQQEMFETASKLMEQVRLLYDYSKHSAEIIAMYGSDRMPRVYGTHLQFLILMGDLPKAIEYMQYLQTLFPKLDQQFTASLVMIPLTTAFLEFGLYDEALVIFGHGQRNNKNQTQFANFFVSLSAVFERWIECSLRREYEEHYSQPTAAVAQQRDTSNNNAASTAAAAAGGGGYNSTNSKRQQKSRKVDCFSQGSAIVSAFNSKDTVSSGSYKNKEMITLPDTDADPLLEAILNKKEILQSFDKNERPVAYFAMDFFGAGVEMTSASILVNEAWHLKRMLSTPEKLNANQDVIVRAMQYLECALEYVDIYLAYMGEDPTFLASRYRTLLIKAEAAHLLLTLVSTINSADRCNARGGSEDGEVKLGDDTNTTEEEERKREREKQSNEKQQRLEATSRSALNTLQTISSRLCLPFVQWKTSHVQRKLFGETTQSNAQEQAALVSMASFCNTSQEFDVLYVRFLAALEE